ncbi:hypothetical protein RhiLY_06668 [Ceratobasidium sp. AG-Ba]|nr:hypothetical protein RhiLY_06668 [Ceratobasidium sp. AG-Ba]
MDRRTKGLPRFQNLRHFAQGISVISLWTGKEAKALGRTFLSIVAGHDKRDLVKAAKSVVDFMTRAHKHEVTDRDLMAMRQDFLDFDSSKGVFVDASKKGLVNHEDRFHKIPKIHSPTHYPYLICQLGAPEGFNTEITERLHIDFVKKPWSTTNHVNATLQMIAYLENREAWTLLRAYMHDSGLVPDPRLEVHTVEDDKDSGDESEVGNTADDDSSGGRGDDEVWQPAPAVWIAKRPSLATDFVSATIDYLRVLHPARTAFPISHDTVFQVWRRCKLRHRRLPFDPALDPQTDQVRAFNASTDSEGRVLRIRQFDVVLYQPTPALRDRQGLQRLEAGRVRAIFSLADHHQSLCSEKLVYLEQFRPFAQSPITSTSLYTTQHALCRGHRRAVVVLLSQLRMTCHLVPQYNYLPADFRISSSTDLLAEHRHFSLNKYASPWLFSVLDYWENRRLNAAW